MSDRGQVLARRDTMAAGGLASTLRWLRPSRETVAADAALVALVAAIAVLVGVSQISLEAFGYTYISAGGPFWQKVHPATPIAVLALVFRCIASGRPLATAVRLATNDAGVLLYLAAIGLTGMFAVIVVKTPVTPLIDTFILPVLFFWLLRDLDRRIARALALALAVFLAVNAIVALSEFLTGWRLVNVPVPDGVTADPLRTDLVFDWRADLAMEWRATALLGHPIESGGIVGAFILCLAARGCRWLPPFPRLSLLGLQAVSLVAYGTRLPLVLATGMAIVVGLHEGGLKLMHGTRPGVRVWALVACAVPILIGGAALAYDLGFFDRIIDRFTNDLGSASARVTMFRMFDPLSLYDLLFGPKQDLIETWKRLEGLEFGIESSWVGLVLTYGLIVAGLLMLGLAAFAVSVIRTAGRGAWTVEVFFFVVISVSTALAGKTTALATVTVLILLFVRRDATPTPFSPFARDRRVAERRVPTDAPAERSRER